MSPILLGAFFEESISPAFRFYLILAQIFPPPFVIKTAFFPNPVMNDIARAVNRVAMDYPELRGVTVTEVDIQIGVYAYAAEPRIVFNRQYSSDENLFSKLVHEDIQSDYHPELGVCSPAELLAYHEAAHIIDQRNGLRPRMAATAEFFPGMGLDLPGYAFRGGVLHVGEALAESFAAVHCNGGNSIERALAALLD